MDPQLKSQLKQVLSLGFTAATVNAFGEVAALSAATAYCRVVPDQREFERMDGTWVKSSHRIVLDCPLGTGITATPTFDTRVWLPGESSATAALANKIQHLVVGIDERGNVDHFELWI